MNLKDFLKANWYPITLAMFLVAYAYIGVSLYINRDLDNFRGWGRDGAYCKVETVDGEIVLVLCRHFKENDNHR